MLFIILCWLAPAVFLVVWIGYVVFEYRAYPSYRRVDLEDVIAGFGWGVLWSIVTFVVGLLALMIAAVITPDTLLGESTETHALQAVATGNETDGRFYLLGGTVDSEPTFSYIREEGDALVLRSVDADQSYVYQGDHEPRLEIITYRWGDPVIFPGAHSEGHSYLFYVPEGSVANTFEVAP